jgi:ABC-type lipoprotein export system ATPase subunit
MGKSGTGKTTLLRLLVGELKVPHGQVHYRDEDMSQFTELDRENYRKKI